MKVLIVQSERGLANIWQRHLQRMGMNVLVCHDQDGAIANLAGEPSDIVVLDLLLSEGSAFAVADYVSYRLPDTRIVFVTSTSFFSDGSIFSFASNACACVQRSTPLDDLAAIVEHYGRDATDARAPDLY